MKKCNGFTLIELLAVIIILAALALIATPILLNVVDKVKASANLQTVNGILDAARIYYSESMLDPEMKVKVENVNNIYPDIKLHGDKPGGGKNYNGEPVEGKLYVTEKGLTAVSVVIDKKCYIKKFDSTLEIIEDEKCDLGIIEKDTTNPTLAFNYSEATGNNEWYVSNMWVTITASDNESGINKLNWCISQNNECIPNIEISPKEDKKIMIHGVNITTESEKNYVCVIVIDEFENSKKNCSNIIKLDKTAPILKIKAINMEVIKGEETLTSDYFEAPIYSISKGSTNCNPINTAKLEIGNQNVTCTAIGNNGLVTTTMATINIVEKDYLDLSGASAPDLENGLVPIRYNGKNWIVANTKYEWYNYDKKEWANAIIVNKEKKSEYVANKIVVEGDVHGYFVWIPRYEYIVGEKEKAITIDFVSKQTNKNIKTHPAFTFGETELEGIWVGKFETTGGPSVRPNSAGIDQQSVASCFKLAQTFVNYGLTNSDSHMMKNSEWGAVAYLSQSTYGRCTSATSCPEIGINNRASITGTGTYPGGTVTSSSNSYDTKLGQKASTTQNIYGIYDMSGGLFEYVMGTYSNEIGSSGFTTLPDAKYYDSYSSTSTTTACDGDICYGHALSEVSGWYADNTNIGVPNYPWIIRGGYYDGKGAIGIFASTGNSGSATRFRGFRTVISRP